MVNNDEYIKASAATTKPSLLFKTMSWEPVWSNGEAQMGHVAHSFSDAACTSQTLDRQRFMISEVMAHYAAIHCLR